MPDPELTYDAIARAYVSNRGSGKDTADALGCSKKTVYTKLKSQEGQAALAEYVGQVLEQYHVSAMRVVGEAAAIAFSDLPRILRDGATLDGLNNLEPHHRAAISQLEIGEDGGVVKIRLHPKLDSLKLLAQYADIAGLGSTPADDPTSGRAELGGLTLIGATEATIDEVGKSIPRPEKLD